MTGRRFQTCPDCCGTGLRPPGRGSRVPQIVYVLEADCMGVFASLAEAMAYPFDAGLVAPDAPCRWQEERRDGKRVWLLWDHGEVCVITEEPVIGAQAA